MYVEHPYKFNDKFYAKVDGKFYEITREVAKASGKRMIQRTQLKSEKQKSN